MNARLQFSGARKILERKRDFKNDEAGNPPFDAPWYAGLGSGAGIPWRAWIVPLLAWGVFFAAAFSMMACLAILNLYKCDLPPRLDIFINSPQF